MTEITTVCVYCGSSNAAPEVHRRAAARFGTLLGEAGLRLVYGGGRVGLMGIVADAVLAAGGYAVGIIPDHIQAKEVEHRGLNELIVVDSMHTRKRAMFDRSDAFVVLPGGLGTLDELVEIVTWRQLGLHDKPLVLVDIDGFWQPLLTLIDHMVDQRFVRPEDRRIWRVVPTVDDVLPALARAPEPTVEPHSKWL